MNATTVDDVGAAQGDSDRLGQEMVEAMGRFFEGFGFRRHLGRTWMVLYLSDEPMTQTHLQAELGLSAGMVSTLLRELVSWGAVRTRTLPASRQTWYESETRLLAYVSRILERRDLPHVQDLDRTVHRVITELESHDSRAAKRLLRKLDPIRQLARLYESMATLVIRMATGPTGSIRKGIQLVRGLRVE